CRTGRRSRRAAACAACRFHLRSYHEDLRALVPDGADLIIAIESLAHALPPEYAIANLANTLRRGGMLIVVDDVPDDGLAHADADFARLRAGWRCGAILNRAALLAALSDAGLDVERDEDLTPLVP